MKRMRRTIAWLLTVIMVISSFASGTVSEAATVKKLAVKAKGPLQEGQILTKKMLKKNLTVKAKYANRKKKKTVTSYTCKQIGKRIKPISSGANKGKFKLKISFKGKSKKVFVNVDFISDLLISTTLALKEGETFSEADFRENTVIKAVYESERTKRLTSYSVSAPSKVLANSEGNFVVIVTCGSVSQEVQIPVEKNSSEDPENTQQENQGDNSVENPSEENTDGNSGGSTTGGSTGESSEGDTTGGSTDESSEGGTTGGSTDENPEGSTTGGNTGGNSGGGTSGGNTGGNSGGGTTGGNTGESSSGSTTGGNSATEDTAKLTVKMSGNGTIILNSSTITEYIYSVDVTKGSTVTLSAKEAIGYRFIHWTDGENELSTNATESFTVNADRTVMAVFEKVYTVTFTRNGNGSITFDGTDYTTSVTKVEVTAGTYTVTATPDEGWYFVKYVKDSISTSSTSYKLSVTANTEIEVDFAEEETTVIVSYCEKETGRVFFSEAVTKGSSLTPPTEKLYRTGKTFKGWELNGKLYEGNMGDTEFYYDPTGTNTSLSDAEEEATQTGDVTAYAYYVVDNPTVTVTIDGGTITKTDGTKTTDGSVTVNNGDMVTISVNIPSGKYFEEWVNKETQTKINSLEEFSMTITEDISLEAKFSDSLVTAEPSVYFTGSKYTFNSTGNKYSIYYACDIPEGYEKIEWGMMTSIVASDSEMLLDNPDVKHYADTNDSTKSELVALKTMTIGANNWIANHNTVRIRIYATIKNPAGSTYTIYSDEILKFEF